MLNQMVLAVVGIIVGVILITSQATTINTNTNTQTNGNLENVSSSAKSIYGLYDFVWSIAGLVLIVGGLATFYHGAKKHGA